MSHDIVELTRRGADFESAENAEAESFGSDVFLERVARRADVDDATAREYVGAVKVCLDAVVPDAELERAGAQLPPAYEDLLTPAV